MNIRSQTTSPGPEEDFLAKAQTLAQALPFMRRYATARASSLNTAATRWEMR